MHHCGCTVCWCTICTLEHLTFGLGDRISKRGQFRLPHVVCGYEIENTIVNIVYKHMKLSPPFQTCNIDRAHIILRRITEGRLHTVIVRFTTHRRRNATYKARVNLKMRNAASVSRDRSYINEDLTNYRSELLYELRKIKKGVHISDCWTYNGNILSKNTNTLS